MKLISLILLASFIIAGCASSENNSDRSRDFNNLVEITPPGNEPEEISKVYVDSAEVITRNGKKALLISGNFPDGCTNLKSVTHTLGNGKLRINMTAWRNPEKMCTQALVAFSFIYNEVDSELNKNPALLINGTPYELE